MRKVILYIAMSLDGYIADKDGGVSWLNGDGSDSENEGSYSEFIETVDTVIMGYKTYHQVVTELSPNEWVYSGMKSYVITHKEMQSTDEIIFTDKPLESLMEELKEKNGKDIWICGGSSIVNQMIEFELIDEICVSVIPVILGEGIRLFDAHKKTTNLNLVSTRSYNGITDLRYEVKK